MEKTKILEYTSLKTPYKNIISLIFTIIFVVLLSNIGICINKEIIILIFVYIIYLAWLTIYARNYRIYHLILKNNKLNIQAHKGLKIKNIDIDINDIQKFQVNIDVNYKRFFIGMFDIDIRIDLKNGQQYDMKNRTKRVNLFKVLANVVKTIPNSNIFINSNFDKGEYTKDNLEYYLNFEESPKKTFPAACVGFIIILAIMIVAFINMFIQ